MLFLLSTNLLSYFGFSSLIQRTAEKALDDKRVQMSAQCEMLADQVRLNGLSLYHVTEDTSQDQSYINRLELAANNLDGRILLIDKQFMIIFDSFHMKEKKYLLTENTIACMQNHQSDAYQDEGRMEIITVINDLKSGETQGAMILIPSLRAYDSELRYLQSQKNILLGIFFLISLGVSFVIMRVIRTPFYRMQRELYSVVAGHQDTHLSKSAFQEFNQIAKAFNTINERYQQLENSRQEFVSNVSHELKTPITSMKILADSLVMQDNIPIEIYKEFMEDIVHEIDRESQIITDLLELVKMDKKQADLTVVSTNINELLEEILKRISPIADKREVTLRLETMRAVTAEVDRGKLSMALTNLIENAVKYNKDAGSVDVSLNADHKWFYIRIKDTGIGIPEDCRELIFERFYRVDKARSRDTGGTGLGLAITRNIILLHKGSIKVHSRVGEGSTFTVRIPLNYV